MSIEEWVHRLNQLAGEIETWMLAVHPSCWQSDQQLAALNEAYRELARRGPDESIQEDSHAF